MSSIDRPLSGEALRFDLDEEREEAATPSILERNGHNARTLLKNGPMRVVLIVMAPGSEIPEHDAEGPVAVQPLDGRIRFTAGANDYDLEPGRLLCFGPGVRHRVSSERGGAFLLTVVHPGTGGDGRDEASG